MGFVKMVLTMISTRPVIPVFVIKRYWEGLLMYAKYILRRDEDMAKQEKYLSSGAS